MRLIQPMVLSVLLAGCGGGSSYGGTNTSVFTSVTIAPSSASAYQFSGTPTVLHVTAHDQNNADMSSAGATTVWHVAPSGIATVNGSGEIVVSSATPTLLTVSVDLTLQGSTHTSPDVQVQTEVAPTQAAVVTAGNSFSPATVHITANGSVNWSGLSASHNVHFSSATPFNGVASNGTPGSSNTATGIFATVGSYPYLCDFHGAAMSGTVVVH